MPKKIDAPTIIKAAGNKAKNIEEYVGRVNTGTSALSIARMVSEEGWEEPGQKPEFDEYTVVLKGRLRVEYDGGIVEAGPGEAIVAPRGEWLRYSTPFQGGAEYVSVCLPAFSPDTVHRDA